MSWPEASRAGLRHQHLQCPEQATWVLAPAGRIRAMAECSSGQPSCLLPSCSSSCILPDDFCCLQGPSHVSPPPRCHICRGVLPSLMGGGIRAPAEHEPEPCKVQAQLGAARGLLGI